MQHEVGNIKFIYHRFKSMIEVKQDGSTVDWIRLDAKINNKDAFTRECIDWIDEHYGLD
jgi:hypothetical protein